MSKKDFTKADGAIDKMFTLTKPAYDANLSNDTPNTNYTNISNNSIDANITKDTFVSNNATNKSKYYNERGPRKERMGLLLDKPLKEDLTRLYKATDSKSVNDLIFDILLAYVEDPANQAKLAHYNSLRGEM